jgi:hypothetical protein
VYPPVAFNPDTIAVYDHGRHVGDEVGSTFFTRERSRPLPPTEIRATTEHQCGKPPRRCLATLRLAQSKKFG